ncbi:MAG: acetylglutamate kinase [Alphaproteobacteria bacterium]|nr:acetylglutamate kinase [Alphaproteobacteria bacterium]
MRTTEADAGTVVVKYGGAAMKDAGLSETLMRDLVALQARGARVVLVHGGGAAVTEIGRRLGLEARFVDGLRVTDPETMRVAQRVQVGEIGRGIVAAIGRAGGRALGLSGHDLGGWLRGARRQHIHRQTGEPVDLGRVGDICAVDAAALSAVLDQGWIPVVAPVAVDADFEALNVNADSVATAVAAALQADRLVLLTDVDGVRGADGQPARAVSADTLRAWIASGVVSGGMIPKAEGCLDALAGGVGAVSIADGRVPHALLGAFSASGGTEVHP